MRGQWWVQESQGWVSHWDPTTTTQGRALANPWTPQTTTQGRALAQPRDPADHRSPRRPVLSELQQLRVLSRNL